MGNARTTSILAALFAVLVAYMGYTGAGLDLVGMHGLKPRIAHVDSLKDSLAFLQTRIDTAKRDLARESVEDLQARVTSYKASLGVLRTLVPEQREVADLLDDIETRARVRGLNVSGFVPMPIQAGPPPFDTYAYQLSVIGRYNNVGAFLGDVASLRRIIVPGDVIVAAADPLKARALGDTVAMLEARLTIRTYVKGKTAEDTVNAQ